MLGQTAGYGHAHSIYLDLLHDKIRHRLPSYLCDGDDECIKAVRMQICQGAKLIKVAASGGVSSLLDAPQVQQFSHHELEAIVEEASRADRIVAAHCHGKEGIITALHAGCTAIEHGSYLDQEAIDLMLGRNVILVPTRTILEYGVRHPEAYSEGIYAKLFKFSEAHKKSYELAVKAGIRIALGTDLGVSSLTARYNHGMNGSEYRYAITAGMTTLQAIEAETANGLETLGLQGLQSGQLKRSYDADFIALSHNPLEDIDVLAHPDKVIYIWKGGCLQKSSSKPVSFLA